MGRIDPGDVLGVGTVTVPRRVARAALRQVFGFRSLPDTRFFYPPKSRFLLIGFGLNADFEI
jgi:hypothetical protein